MNVRPYRYFDKKTKGLDFDGMIADLKAATPGSTVLLHTCAHNPTGVDLSNAQWEDVGPYHSDDWQYVFKGNILMKKAAYTTTATAITAPNNNAL